MGGYIDRVLGSSVYHDRSSHLNAVEGEFLFIQYEILILDGIQRYGLVGASKYLYTEGIGSFGAEKDSTLADCSTVPERVPVAVFSLVELGDGFRDVDVPCPFLDSLPVEAVHKFGY